MAAFEKRSATIVDSLVSSLNARNCSAAMALAVARLSPLDAARARTPGKADIVSSIEKPARAKLIPASPTSLALKTDALAKSRMAVPNPANWVSVASETAPIVDILASKPAPISTTCFIGAERLFIIDAAFWRLKENCPKDVMILDKLDFTDWLKLPKSAFILEKFLEDCCCKAPKEFPNLLIEST